MKARIQTADFDLGEEVAQLRAPYPQVGAVVSFLGTVRDLSDGVAVSAMTLEHYAGMTEKVLEEIRITAISRWDLIDALIIHRVGELKQTDQIVLVAAVSMHRQAAFQACEYMMDYLKTSAPFWKKETTPHGAHWVDARSSDEDLMARWLESVEDQK